MRKGLSRIAHHQHGRCRGGRQGEEVEPVDAYEAYLEGYSSGEASHRSGVELFEILMGASMKLILGAREGLPAEEQARLQGAADYAREALTTSKRNRKG